MAPAYLQSGVAYTVVNATSRTNTGNNAGTLNGGDRPNVNGDPNLPSSEQTVQRWFDTSVFSAADLVHVRQRRAVPDAWARAAADGHVASSRICRWAATASCSSACEVYNITNTPSFWLPDFNFGSTGFGSISSTGNSIPRQMQFGVKYLF